MVCRFKSCHPHHLYHRDCEVVFRHVNMVFFLRKKTSERTMTASVLPDGRAKGFNYWYN